MRWIEMQLWPANENAFVASARRRLEIGVLLDDQRSRVAKLEGDPLARRALAHRPADLGRAGERDQPHTLVVDERVADLGRGPEERSASRRKPRLRLELGEEERRERRRQAGFRTTAQPAASAGAILCATRLSGKLNGQMAPTTPIGRRIVNASFPAPAGEASIGTISPASLRASTAANVYVDTALSASTRAAFSGLPASAQIARAPRRAAPE